MSSFHTSNDDTLHDVLKTTLKNTILLYNTDGKKCIRGNKLLNEEKKTQEGGKQVDISGSILKVQLVWIQMNTLHFCHIYSQMKNNIIFLTTIQGGIDLREIKETWKLATTEMRTDMAKCNKCTGRRIT